MCPKSEGIQGFNHVNLRVHEAQSFRLGTQLPITTMTACNNTLVCSNAHRFFDRPLYFRRVSIGQMALRHLAQRLGNATRYNQACYNPGDGCFMGPDSSMGSQGLLGLLFLAIAVPVRIADYSLDREVQILTS
ncbi:hypothetical protein N7493_010628 [Penicillium malachiteum]|uniref:Uncharacterized protein n=1 Tax=Penicillium malachiteum TaxID=1324776 RepID=A0AAD6HD30_9EURO|nr:hypothetical protein N7493_010628 [Penicillium malachiteum]